MEIELATAVSFFAWIYLILLRGRFWRTDIVLPPGDNAPASWPSVAAVVPARDEAAVIGRAVASIAAQDYPGNLSLVVVDDGSSDGTAEVASDAAPETRIVTAAPRPAGWTGKLWALENGVRAVRGSEEPEFLWFTDADVAHAPDELRRLAGHAATMGLDVASLMVRLHCRGPWEGLLIPAFVYFFQMLYPFVRVNRRGGRVAAAAGGSMLIRADALARIGGLDSVRGALIDDCALARAVKGGGGAIWLGLTRETASIRPYDGLVGIWWMVARTAFHQLRYSAVLLVLTVAAMALVFLAPPLAVLFWPWHGSGIAALLGAAGWALMALSWLPLLRFYGRPPAAALLLPLAALLYVLMTADSARRQWRGRGGEWKSRHHSPEGGSIG